MKEVIKQAAIVAVILMLMYLGGLFLGYGFLQATGSKTYIINIHEGDKL